VRTLLRVLGMTMTDVLDRGHGGASATRMRELVALMEHTADVLDHDADDGAAPPPHAPDAAEVDEALRISMRQQLFGRHVLVKNHAGAGLVRIALIQLLALAGARRDAGRRALTAADLNRGHTLATRGFQTGRLDDVLAANDPQWRVLLAGHVRAVGAFAGPAKD
jgi:hypothetical protein